MTQKTAVLALLQDGDWHPTQQLVEKIGDGSIRRLRELRSLGYNIELKKINNRNFAYRLESAAKEKKTLDELEERRRAIRKLVFG
jgi:hypothetical protein